ncbi:MAG: hypothetical protein K2Y15_05915 [Burkholderiaceae bacterium]|nr:hypothetical protein [Burkholderiaceae bacterium]
MAGKNYTINLEPILKALERLICDPSGVEFSAEEKAEIIAVYRVLMEVATQDPRAPMEFYNQLGVNVTIYLARRVAAQEIAANLVKRLRPPEA